MGEVCVYKCKTITGKNIEIIRLEFDIWINGLDVCKLFNLADYYDTEHKVSKEFKKTYGEMRDIVLSHLPDCPITYLYEPTEQLKKSIYIKSDGIRQFIGFNRERQYDTEKNLCDIIKNIGRYGLYFPSLKDDVEHFHTMREEIEENRSNFRSLRKYIIAHHYINTKCSERLEKIVEDNEKCRYQNCG